jgi:hypothetical protein
MKSLKHKFGGILLVIAFFVFSFTDVWGANWVKFHESKKGDEIWFYDTESLTRTSCYIAVEKCVKVWVKTVYKKGLTQRIIDRIKGKNVSMKLALVKLDCSEKKVEIIQWAEYSQDGSVLKAGEASFGYDFYDIAPETMMECLYNLICKWWLPGAKP